MTITEIDQVSRDRYGVGVLQLPTYAALWLIEYIQAAKGIDVNRQVRAYRTQHGKGTSYPT